MLAAARGPRSVEPIEGNIMDKTPVIANGHVRLKHCRHGTMIYLASDRYVGQSLDRYGQFSEGGGSSPSTSRQTWHYYLKSARTWGTLPRPPALGECRSRFRATSYSPDFVQQCRPQRTFNVYTYHAGSRTQILQHNGSQTELCRDQQFRRHLARLLCGGLSKFLSRKRLIPITTYRPAI